MATPITHFILTRLRSDQVQVDIYDATSYASRQVYVDNALLVETAATSFLANIQANKKVDILGLTAPEAGTDFSSSLSDDNGDKIEFDLPASYTGLKVRVYSDVDTAVVDFGKPLGEGTAGDNVVSDLLNFGELTLQGYGDLTLSGFGSLLLTGDGQEPYVKLFISKRLANGTYKFAIVNYNAADNEHAPIYITKTIATRPDEPSTSLISYDPDTDELHVEVTSSGAGTYSVYAAPFGASQDQIDFSTPIKTATTPSFSITGFRGVNTDGFRLLVVRKTVSGIEDQSTTVLRFSVSSGDWINNFPSSPSNLTGTVLATNKVRLKWQYQARAIVPEGFKIYSGTGTVDYSMPVGTVSYVGEGIISTDLPAISAPTIFGVRAFYGGNDDTNTETISITPLVLPVVVTGAGVETWKDQ